MPSDDQYTFFSGNRLSFPGWDPTHSCDPVSVGQDGLDLPGSLSIPHGYHAGPDGSEALPVDCDSGGSAYPASFICPDIGAHDPQQGLSQVNVPYYVGTHAGQHTDTLASCYDSTFRPGRAPVSSTLDSYPALVSGGFNVPGSEQVPQCSAGFHPIEPSLFDGQAEGVTPHITPLDSDTQDVASIWPWKAYTSDPPTAQSAYTDSEPGDNRISVGSLVDNFIRFSRAHSQLDHLGQVRIHKRGTTPSTGREFPQKHPFETTFIKSGDLSHEEFMLCLKNRVRQLPAQTKTKSSSYNRMVELERRDADPMAFRTPKQISDPVVDAIRSRWVEVQGNDWKNIYHAVPKDQRKRLLRHTALATQSAIPESTVLPQSTESSWTAQLGDPSQSVHVTGTEVPSSQDDMIDRLAAYRVCPSDSSRVIRRETWTGTPQIRPDNYTRMVDYQRYKDLVLASHSSVAGGSRLSPYEAVEELRRTRGEIPLESSGC